MILDLIAQAGDDSPIWLLAAGPAGGAGTYWLIYRYYRNNDKSHSFERETIIEAQPVQGGEERVDHISKTRDSDIDGDNSGNYRARVQRIR
ncbi:MULTISPECIES: hypothetical protein [unclassified Nocardioides]|jgi:hypothetical protein|uniref:hypothetical protein n=1 Tax=unclassified Nocardioides TaxID=2615069 RepID=UPI0007026EE2|nr:MULTISPECIES: hypothetical protein [unclassified Nocardioides]KRC46146.1 hypothetical protein ASE19_19960 [Nocardioides sp. Root79]KRC69494.1 hypothetical protein ASE20_12820 [Nocardioides sp. Root240]